MSADYGKTFPYVLAESVLATDGSCSVALPNITVGNVDVDFVTATRSMRGGIIRIEEIGGVAYTLTTLSPENGGGFNVSGGSVVPVTYTVAATAEPAFGGSVLVTGGGTSATVTANSQVTLIAAPENGYTFKGWYKDGMCVATTYKYTFDAVADVAYKALFEEDEVFEASIETVNSGNDVQETIHDLWGRKVKELSKSGIYIINGKKAVR